MKKTIAILSLLIVSFVSSNAQNTHHALGLRFGAGSELGTEITYQNRLDHKNRFEVDFGFHSNYEYINDFRHDYNSWILTGLYHWTWKIKQQEGLSWYAGPGLQVGAWSSNLIYGSRYKGGMFLDLAGDTGIEYSFPAGIQFSLDLRPEVGLFNCGSRINLGLSVRYLFN